MLHGMKNIDDANTLFVRICIEQDRMHLGGQQKNQDEQER